MGKHKVLNTPAIRRIPTYLHKLMLMHAAGEEFVSTSKLADYMDLINKRNDEIRPTCSADRGVV